MRDIIKDLIKETEIDYHVLGLCSNEEFAGRIGAFSRLLGECDKIDNAVDKKDEEPEWYEGHYNEDGDWVEGYFK